MLQICLGAQPAGSQESSLTRASDADLDAKLDTEAATVSGFQEGFFRTRQDRVYRDDCKVTIEILPLQRLVLDCIKLKMFRSRSMNESQVQLARHCNGA